MALARRHMIVRGVLTPGTSIAQRYRVEAFLAEGGMGQVYKVHDLDLDVCLALKTIRPEVSGQPMALRRFKQEVLLARSVTHTNVCRIFDLGRDELHDMSFLTMEFLPGETLSSYIARQGALDADETLSLVRQMAGALDTAHRAGIVHRDFKSPNVMVVPESTGARAVITDFGLAVAPRGADRDTGARYPPSAGAGATGEILPGDQTQELDLRDGPTLARTDSVAGAIVGTPAYMSPEQVRGEPVSAASDLYALGVVLFEMRTGRLPFRGATPMETAQAHLRVEPPSPCSIVEMGQHWETAILRLLAKDPRDRFASAGEVLLALEGRANDRGSLRHSLPPEHDQFVGRSSELDALAGYLEGSAAREPVGHDGATRLLTVLGPGGTGKTRLVQRYGWDSLARWAGGVWFCDLSEARSSEGVVVAVAKSLGVPLSQANPVEQLGNAIAGRGRCLVVLDNFEQVEAYAAPTLGYWLERAGEARFLATSRARLQLPGETVLEVEPLDPISHGVELFEVRARTHRPGFTVDASNRTQVEKVVQQLDGLPLAIELAASRLRMLSLHQLDERLHDRFKVLSGGAKGRHAALRTTLEWSWDLLSSVEQSVLAQISVFEGGFTLEAAEAVVEISDADDGAFVLDVIQSLVDKSWVRARVSSRAPRFEMYSTLQEFAGSKLRAAESHAPPANLSGQCGDGDATAAMADVRHGRYFGRMGEIEELEALSRHGGTAKREALQAELDNLVAACRRAVIRGDESTAVSAYLAADAVLTNQGPYSASRRLGGEVLQAVHRADLRVRVLIAVAETARLLGDLDETEHFGELALQLCRSVGDRKNEGRVLIVLANVVLGRGRYDEAQERYEVALAVARAEHGVRSEGLALGNLGVLHMSQGRLEEACTHFEAALQLHRQIGDRRSEGQVLCNLGVAQHDGGKHQEATVAFEGSLDIARETGFRALEFQSLANLGLIHSVLTRADLARAHYEMAMGIQRDIGNRGTEAFLGGNLGVVCLEAGWFDEARIHLEAAVTFFRGTEDGASRALFLMNLGALNHQEDRFTEAREDFEEALDLCRGLGIRRLEGITLTGLGDLDAKTGRVAEARSNIETGIQILRELGDRWRLVHALCLAARLEHSAGDTQAAHRAFVEAESVAGEIVPPPLPESLPAKSLRELQDVLKSP